jgi:two-component system response regulator DevR
VQGLGADDDRVEVEVLLVGVPAAVVDPAEHPEQVDRVDAAAPGDAVLAVGREGVVLRAQRAAGADLGGLLPEQAGPQAQLALALQRGGLGVEPPDQHEVAVEPRSSSSLRAMSYSGCATRSPSGDSSWTAPGLRTPSRLTAVILALRHTLEPAIRRLGLAMHPVVHNDGMSGVPESPTVIRVFLMDDHEIVRRGLADLIGLERDMEVVGEAGSTADALHRIPASRPDVAVLDVRLPDGSGVEVCRDVRSSMPEVHCLMLTSYADDEALFDAIMAGASGYVLKEIRGNDLVDAIRQVASGKSLLDPMATQRVLERLRNGEKHDSRLDALSDQEKRILELIGEGMTNRQIGEQMHLAEKTVKNYVSSLLAKLGMERRTQAAAFVARMSAEQDHR